MFWGLLVCPWVYSDVVVIVNPSIKQEFTDRELQRIFLGKTTRFDNGERINCVVSDQKQIRHIFNQSVLKRTDQQIKTYWTRKIFTAKGFPPDRLTDETIIGLVQKNPGYIGYVDSEQLSQQKVRIIKKIPF